MRFGGRVSSGMLILGVLIAAPRVCVASDAVPGPIASPSPIPEIGRVRAASPPCTAMRELVFPAFQAAARANRVFDEGAPAYAKYAEIAGNHLDDARLDARFGKAHQPASSDGAALNERNFYLARISKDVTTIQQQTLAIAKALGDPRLSEKAAASDETTAAERRELQRLYAVQSARAAVLSEFLIRQGVKIARESDGDDAGLGGSLSPQATPTPLVTDRVRFGQPPTLGGDGNADAGAMRTWTTDMGTAARAASLDLARDMTPIAQSCQ